MLNSTIRKLVTADLRKLLMSSENGIERFCVHANLNSGLHVMLIRLPANLHYPPHRHTDTDEWYYVLEGSIVVSTYRSDGVRLSRTELVPFHLTASSSHGLLMQSNVWHDTEAGATGALFMEVRNGPFDKSNTFYLNE